MAFKACPRFSTTGLDLSHTIVSSDDSKIKVANYCLTCASELVVYNQANGFMRDGISEDDEDEQFRKVKKESSDSDIQIIESSDTANEEAVRERLPDRLQNQTTRPVKREAEDNDDEEDGREDEGYMPRPRKQQKLNKAAAAVPSTDTSQDRKSRRSIPHAKFNVTCSFPSINSSSVEACRLSCGRKGKFIVYTSNANLPRPNLQFDSLIRVTGTRSTSFYDGVDLACNVTFANDPDMAAFWARCLSAHPSKAVPGGSLFWAPLQIRELVFKLDKN